MSISLYQPMYRTLLTIALIISGLSISYSSEISYYRLKGVVTDIYGTPLDGVAFQTIFQSHDQQAEADSLNSISIRDTTYYSDKNGVFDLYPLPQGALHLKVSKLNYLPLDFDLDIKSDFLEATLSLQEDPEAKAKMLEEIEVNAKMLKNYADRTELYLTKDNRKFGINALDAISSLPLFRQNINSRKLENMKGENVNILINGRRASIEEIRNLNGENIKKVIYYDNAPARYAGFFGGAVANVILKTPEELTVTGNLNAAGSNTYSIQSAVGAALMSPHNYANASFNINYFNQSDRKHESTFDYGDLVNSYSLDEGKERTTTTMTDLSYQWENQKHMLFTNFSYSSSTSRRDDRYRISELQNNTNIEGSRLKGAHPISDRFNADIYYSYIFDSGQELSVDILNSFNKNSRHIYDIQTVDSQSAYTDYSIDESTHNDIYTLIANIMFSTPLFGGNLSATLIQNYVNLRQLYSNTYFQDQPSHNDNEQLYSALWASYSRKFNNFGMLLTLMGGNTHIRFNDRSSHNEFRVYPKINLNYSFSDRYTLYFSTWVQSSQNSLGAMNQNRYFIDTRYFAENLPYEKEVMKYSASISGSFLLPVWNMMLFPHISYGYTVKPYLDYLSFASTDFP